MRYDDIKNKNCHVGMNDHDKKIEL